MRAGLGAIFLLFFRENQLQRRAADKNCTVEQQWRAVIAGQISRKAPTATKLFRSAEVNWRTPRFCPIGPGESGGLIKVASSVLLPTLPAW
ncbi:unnamed protein product [Ciceribacter sp. T2.26MG-112.2]|nr:unnamed protein product [Ciceribacter naphthalenivorans]